MNQDINSLIASRSSVQGGFLVWLNMDGSGCEYDRLVQLATKYGVAKGYLRDRLKGHSIFLRAKDSFNQWAKTREGQQALGLAEGQEVKLDEMSKTGRAYTYAIQFKDKRSAIHTKDNPYDRWANILFIKKANQICYEILDQSRQNEVLLSYSKIGELYKLKDATQELSLGELRDIVYNFLGNKGVCLNAVGGNGGLYFVPINYQSELSAIADMMAEIDCRNIINFPEIATSQQAQSHYVSSGSQGLVKEIQKTIADTITALQNQNWERSVEKLVPVYANLKKKATEVSQTLGFVPDDLINELNTLIDAIQKAAGNGDSKHLQALLAQAGNNASASTPTLIPPTVTPIPILPVPFNQNGQNGHKESIDTSLFESKYQSFDDL